jgi:hypothetical protein
VVISEGNNMAPDQQVPGDVAWREGQWFRLGRWWGRAHYFLGVIAVVAPILAGVLKQRPDFQGSMTALAALCAALITFLQPSKKSDGYWRAWRHLDAAIRRYRAGDLGRDDLNRAIDEGWMILESNAALEPSEKH